MSESCPFCKFERSDFRQSHNWNCAHCGKDYADWLLMMKSSQSSQSTPESKTETIRKETTLFSTDELPLEAKPVKAAQSLLVLVVLILLALNFVIEGIFSWLGPVTVPLVSYYALTIYRSGFALGRNEVYQREKNPLMFRAHFFGAIALVLAALGSMLI
ncbi:hypothetical protein [Reinekea sp.]|jgi:hypothetical protein|uniref:hypothetical protein n=1 Tax=Reinekea sp. TaxID=1970455 RepID=UPI0039893E27